MSRATFSPTPNQSMQHREVGEISFAVNQPADLPDRVLKLDPAWQVSTSKDGISRNYAFGSFSKAWKFMSLVADECKSKNHHPSWSNMYDQVTIEWTTHRPKGLSIKDVEMAEFCDLKANEIGLKA